MTKLTDTHRVILAAAAQRDDGRVLPIPDSIKKNRRAQALILDTLVTKKLIAEQPAEPGDVVWREEDEQRFRLVITDVGLRAIGIEPEEEMEADSPPKPPKGEKKPMEREKVASTSSATPTKLAIVLGLLKRDGGVSIEEIMTATGWQAHSVRGTISGGIKKKLGLNVVSELADGKRTYRVGA